jgi:molybdenum cofactor cytidylyltransferase
VTTGVILAGGRATRFGSVKQIAELDGKPLVQHAIDTMANSEVDELVLVLGYEAELVRRACALPDHARVAVNPRYELGLSTSLSVGLTAAAETSDLAVVLLGDEPRLPQYAVARVLDRARTSGADGVRALWHGVPGHPVALRRALWERVHRLTGDSGARELLTGPGVVTVEMGRAAPIDVDDPKGLEALEHERSDVPA